MKKYTAEQKAVRLSNAKALGLSRSDNRQYLNEHRKIIRALKTKRTMIQSLIKDAERIKKNCHNENFLTSSSDATSDLLRCLKSALATVDKKIKNVAGDISSGRMTASVLRADSKKNKSKK